MPERLALLSPASAGARKFQIFLVSLSLSLVRAVPTRIKAAIEGLALQKPPLPLWALHRQVQRFSVNLGEKSPSYKVVYHRPAPMPLT